MPLTKDNTWRGLQRNPSILWLTRFRVDIYSVWVGQLHYATWLLAAWTFTGQALRARKGGQWFHLLVQHLPSLQLISLIGASFVHQLIISRAFAKSLGNLWANLLVSVCDRVLFELIWRDYFRFVSIKYGNLFFHVGKVLLMHRVHMFEVCDLLSFCNPLREEVWSWISSQEERQFIHFSEEIMSRGPCFYSDVSRYRCSLHCMIMLYTTKTFSEDNLVLIMQPHRRSSSSCRQTLESK